MGEMGSKHEKQANASWRWFILPAVYLLFISLLVPEGAKGGALEGLVSWLNGLPVVHDLAGMIWVVREQTSVAQQANAMDQIPLLRVVCALNLLILPVLVAQSGLYRATALARPGGQSRAGYAVAGLFLMAISFGVIRFFVWGNDCPSAFDVDLRQGAYTLLFHSGWTLLAAWIFTEGFSSLRRAVSQEERPMGRS